MVFRLDRQAAAAPRTPAYSGYASVYDEIGQRVFGERIAEATLDYLRRAQRSPSSMIDLACGTGSASLVFAAAGMKVLGIDRSPEMLARAHSTAESAGLQVALSEQDMRSFSVEQPVELLTCFYDAVNYLTEPEDVASLFAQAGKALTAGGLFIFDVNTREKFSAAWNESCVVAVDREDLFGIYQSWYQPETGVSPLTMTFFVRNASGQWDRFDEEHIERAYPLENLAEMLDGAGFQVRATLDYADRFPRFGGAGSERSHRVVFVAERRA